MADASSSSSSHQQPIGFQRISSRDEQEMESSQVNNHGIGWGSGTHNSRSNGNPRGRNRNSTNYFSQGARLEHFDLQTSENHARSISDGHEVNMNAGRGQRNRIQRNQRRGPQIRNGNLEADPNRGLADRLIDDNRDRATHRNTRRGGPPRSSGGHHSVHVVEDVSGRFSADDIHARNIGAPSGQTDVSISSRPAYVSRGFGGDDASTSRTNHSRAQFDNNSHRNGIVKINNVPNEKGSLGIDVNRRSRLNWDSARRSDQQQRNTIQQWRPQQHSASDQPLQGLDSPYESSVSTPVHELTVGEALQNISIGRVQGANITTRVSHKQYKNPRSQKSRPQIITSNTPSSMVKDRTDVPMLVQELEDKLIRGKVECMICYDIVRREAAMWSCAGCFAIFHVSCIRKWARAPISADFSIAASGQTMAENWRCPGCQSPQFITGDEIKYRCFCGQVRDPPVDFYLTPHSCGGPCRKPLSSVKNPHCKHTCTMQCHPGPCPPCNALAPPQFCPCGKTSYTQRCSELKTAKSCGQICGHQLQCGRHYCDKICHEGPCGNCDVLLTVNCFCGSKKEAMLCSAMGLQGELDWEGGVFSCDNPCPNKLNCGKHSCDERCHPGSCGECELSPQKLQTCPCGKTRIERLLGTGKQRKYCTDPVPLCGRSCQKLLPCGKHTCETQCHTGDCPPCNILVEQKCRCRLSSQTVPCHKVSRTHDHTDEVFLCSRKCEKKKSCGRHRCTSRCCLLASDANNNLHGKDNPHLCTLPCGKKLRCGQHCCEQLCHNGYCPPCLESTFTELSCACGKTSIPPPVPCGTFPPSCPHPCPRPQPCGHEATHQCHFGECPSCIVLLSKECVGGHVILRNVPCGSKDIKCNMLCGKTRQCQMHACARLCHLLPCDEATFDDEMIRSCGQQCGAPRRDCQHVCVAPCHPGASCPETRCKFPVTITCSCGRLSEQVPCDAGERSKTIDPVSYYAKLQLQPVDSKSNVPLGQRMLACDEECAKLEKKRILANSFVITANDVAISADSLQSASDVLKDLLKRDTQWVLAVEDRIKYLVLGTKSHGAGPIRVHVFNHNSKELREVITQIAEMWNLSVSTIGREPKRFITVHVNSKTKVPPMRNLFGRSPLPLPGQAQAPAFNPSIDMDPRLVVGLFELPRDADISSLVLRFGGECELVWLNDKNALAVFQDTTRATIAVRRVDNASVYTGAVRTSFTVPTSSWGHIGSNEGISRSSLHKKDIEPSFWSEDAWGEEYGRSKPKTVWDRRAPAITTSPNPWGALEQDGPNSRKSMLVVDKPSTSGCSVISSSSVKETLPSNETENWEDLND